MKHRHRAMHSATREAWAGSYYILAYHANSRIHGIRGVRLKSEGVPRPRLVSSSS